MNIGPQPKLGNEKPYSEACFQLKNYFLQQAILPQTFKRRVKVLRDKHEEEIQNRESLQKDVENELRSLNISLSVSDLCREISNGHTPGYEGGELNKISKETKVIDFLRTYEQELSGLKLKMAASQHALTLAYICLCILKAQQIYETMLLNFFNPVYKRVEEEIPGLINKEVKMGEQLSSAEIIEFVKVFGIEELSGAETGENSGEIYSQIKDCVEGDRELAGKALTECKRIYKLHSLKSSTL